MRIKALTPIRIHCDESDQLVSMETGDELHVSDYVGGIACEHGFAQDLDGNVATGEMDLTPKALQANNVKSQSR